MMLGTLILSAMSLLSAFVGLGHGYVRTIGLTDGLSSQAVYALPRTRRDICGRAPTRV